MLNSAICCGFPLSRIVKSFLVKLATGPCLPSTATSTSTSWVLTRNTDGSSAAQHRVVSESGRIHPGLIIGPYFPGNGMRTDPASPVALSWITTRNVAALSGAGGGFFVVTPPPPPPPPPPSCFSPTPPHPSARHRRGGRLFSPPPPPPPPGGKGDKKPLPRAG